MEIKNEKWISLNGRYEVSNYGRVRSRPYEYLDNRNRLRRRRGCLLKFGIRGDGYYVVNVSGYGNKRTWKVHQLVANAFIPNPDNFRCINHKNGIKTDNRVENLEWCSYSHNLKHRYRVLGIENVKNYGSQNGQSKVILDVSTGIYYESIKEASNAYNIKRSTLNAMLNGVNPNKTNLKII